MVALLAVLAGVVGLVLVPLALGPGTAWLLLPAHLMLSVLCLAGTLLSGLDGRPGRARAFGAGFLFVSLAVVVALQVGSDVRAGSWYWLIPWTPALLWSWIPLVVAGFSVWLGARRRVARTRRVVQKRRKNAL